MKKGRKTVPEIEEVIRKRRISLAVRREYMDLFFRIAAIAFIGWLVFTRVFLLAQAEGQGMFPAVKDGDLLIVFRLQQDYEKKDIVTWRKDGKRYTGRIVAFATDQVDMDEEGNLYINGGRLSEEILYPTYNTGVLEYPYRVPEGCVFVLGDYRTEAKDSRELGPVPLQDVEGKVITILRRRGL